MSHTTISLRFIVLISLVSVVPQAQIQAATNETPIAIVKDTITRILSTLADDSLSEEQARKRVAAIANERINYYEMSKRVLAVNWSKTNPEQRKRFVGFFRQKLFDTYWSRFKKYRDKEVIYFTSTIDNDGFATVDTVIQSDTIEIPVTYRLKYAKGKWLAYDFLVENNSLIWAEPSGNQLGSSGLGLSISALGVFGLHHTWPIP